MVKEGLSPTNCTSLVWIQVAIQLLANPSHLEAVDPVVLGQARALQFARYALLFA